MAKKIYINESQLMLIQENTEEVTFYEYFTHIKKFIEMLLKDPNNAEVGSLFTSHGFSKADMLKKLIDGGVVIRKETIKELPYEPNGKKESKYVVKYSVPKKNFDKKLKRLYTELFPDNVNENRTINEDGEGGAVGGTGCGSVMQGGGTNPSAGQYDVPFGGVQKKGFWKPALTRNKDEKNKSISINR